MIQCRSGTVVRFVCVSYGPLFEFFSLEEMQKVRVNKTDTSIWTSPHFRGLVRRYDIEKFLRSFVLLIGYKKLDRMLKVIEESIEDSFDDDDDDDDDDDAENQEQGVKTRNLNDTEWSKLFQNAMDQLKKCSKLKISNTFDITKDQPISHHTLLRNVGDFLIVELNGKLLRKIAIPKHMQECSAYHCRVRVQKSDKVKSNFKSK